jgi:DNA/RNA endonuclease G (NUC1)
LENYIGSKAPKELFCVFVGPILSDGDQTFVCTKRVAIPSRFRKVVYALKEGKLQVCAFILEQDLKDLPLEFQLDAEWKARQVSLVELEKDVKLVHFQKDYHSVAIAR